MTRVLPLALMALAACGGGEAAPAAPEPVAEVAVATVREAPVAPEVTGYGTATTDAGSVQTYTVAFEGVVQQVEVAAGAPVAAGDRLVRLAPSAASRALRVQAEIDAQAQEKAAQTVEERYALHLATRQEREAQQAALDAARARLAALEPQAEGTVRATGAGVVDTVFVAPGQTVGAGTPLVAVAARAGFRLTLGVAAAEVPLLTPGMAVEVVSAGRPQVRANGRLVRVEKVLDPSTRLAQALVAVPGANPFLLGEYVAGTFSGPAQTALVAPRDAILLAEGGPIVFTVRGGRAYHHAVEIVVENGSETGFAAAGVHAGDSVVVGGLAGLSDSLRIRLAP